MTVVCYKTTTPVAKKDHKAPLVFDMFDYILIRDDNKKWIVDPKEIEYNKLTSGEIEIIERRANENFMIHKGEKYHCQTGIDDDFGAYTFKCPLDIYKIIDDHDLWPEE